MEPQGVPLKEVTKLNTLDLVPDVWLIHLSTDCSGRRKTGPSTSTLITFLNLQITVCCVPTKSLQTKPGINLKTQTLKSGFHFARYCRKFHFFKDRGTTCGSSSRLGGPKGDAFSHVSRWPVQAFYLAFSQLETGDDNVSPLIEAFFKGVVESLACFRSNFVVEDPSDKDLPRELSNMWFTKILILQFS